ncbi:exocyst complex component EXO70C1-like [Phragmites australis]|uniref:exocyst complex component EXO70C1-like n=1 Tax=Phragmites australis TaxID=29695 RepID=UPI002D76E1A2|nr:exocyst complex component EXO70C1-like [Phragmites australis]
MDSRSQAPHKSSSFSPATTRDDGGRTREVDRNLSLGAVRHTDKRDLHHGSSGSVAREQIKEECEEEGEGTADHGAPGGDGGGRADGDHGEGAAGGFGGEPDLAALSVEIDAFVAGQDGDAPVSVTEATLEKFASAVELVIAQSEGAEDRWATDASGEPPALLAAITRIAALASALGRNPEGSGKYTAAVHRVTGVLHRAMAFLEDEFHALLEDPRVPKAANEQGAHEPDRCVLPPPPSEASGAGGEAALPYPPETVDRLRSMAEAMIAAGYATECTQMFLVARRNAFDAALQGLGYEKASIDDVVKMAWEALEAEIVAWIKAFRHAINVGLSTEHDLCTRVFAGRHAAVGLGIFADLARCVMLHMLSFTEAVAMTKRAAEKLFKVLDMYEAVRDASPVIDAFLSAPADEPAADCNSSALTELKAETAAVRSRLGESAAAIFRELESSIRADAGKQPVPGGAVHPLTRYVMNYLKYACEYNSTLEQVFREHHRRDGGDGDDNNNPFAAQLMEVMELLHSNLEAKSRLYKDPSLSSIFLMNNGRYMLQKIRGSPEINAMLGEAWARKQSTSLRQYHKNYQRETWSRVLGLLRDDGVLTVKGHVQKPVLKERFKQFNAAMDEIQRTQGAWVVSDEQLQSELRVSIAAVVVPAYRSFLGRFAQRFSAGRQTEKYVKLSAEDVETLIDELFDGNATSMARRRTRQ